MADADVGHGLLHISFRHPGGSYDVLFAQTAPVLRIDGEPVDVAGWNATVTVALSAGRHRILTAFRMGALQTLGLAERRIDIAAGDDRSWNYDAPKLPGRIGDLRETPRAIG